jgi:hypothetical protein
VAWPKEKLTQLRLEKHERGKLIVQAQSYESPAVLLVSGLLPVFYLKIAYPYLGLCAKISLAPSLAARLIFMKKTLRNYKIVPQHGILPT